MGHGLKENSVPSEEIYKSFLHDMCQPGEKGGF